MPKKVIYRKAVKFLREHGELDTVQLRDMINVALKHGTTVSELGNILGKYNDFIKVRTEKRISCSGRSSGNYTVFVWCLRESRDLWANNT